MFEREMAQIMWLRTTNGFTANRRPIIELYKKLYGDVAIETFGMHFRQLRDEMGITDSIDHHLVIREMGVRTSMKHGYFDRNGDLIR